MSVFDPIEYDLRLAEFELTSFKNWLAGVTFVPENVIVAEIRKRRQMACLLGAVVGVQAPDMIKFELELQGLFRTDLVLGNHNQRRFALIEFEGAETNSIFSQRAKQSRLWARQIEHGYSQIIDWAWVRADHPTNSVLTNAFGGAIGVNGYAVVCGRDASLRGDLEHKRFEYRRQYAKVEGLPAQVLTYDGMVRRMDEILEALKTYLRSG